MDYEGLVKAYKNSNRFNYDDNDDYQDRASSLCFAIAQYLLDRDDPKKEETHERQLKKT